jgi:maltose/moltooligosaccharide transporter
LGAVIASLLPYFFTNVLNVSNTAPEGIIPDSVKYSFYIGGFVFFAAVSWTVFGTKELPPENMEEWKEERERSKGMLKGFTEILKGFTIMPPTMLQLAIVQFFTWLALFSMWIYTTPAVAQNAFNSTDTTSKAYQDAADWVGVMFMVYNGVSAITAFLLPMLASKIGRKNTHLLSLIVGGIGLVSMLLKTGKCFYCRW